MLLDGSGGAKTLSALFFGSPAALVHLLVGFFRLKSMNCPFGVCRPRWTQLASSVLVPSASTSLHPSLHDACVPQSPPPPTSINVPSDILVVLPNASGVAWSASVSISMLRSGLACVRRRVAACLLVKGRCPSTGDTRTPGGRSRRCSCVLQRFTSGQSVASSDRKSRIELPEGPRSLVSLVSLVSLSALVLVLVAAEPLAWTS